LEVGVNISSRGLAVAVLVVGGLVVAAYNLGTKEHVAKAPPLSSTDKSSMPHDAAHKSVDLLPGNSKSNLKFAHFRVGNRNVKGMYADGNDVWVGTSGGVIRYNLKTSNYKLYDVKNKSLISNGVFHVSKIDGKMMVGTYGGGLSVYTPETDKWRDYNIPDGLADQFVYDIAKDESTGDYWIATWSGVNRVIKGKMDDPKAWSTFTIESTKGGLPNDWVYGVEIGKNGEIWFATEGGLARYKDGKWKHWTHEDGLGADYDLVKKDITYINDPARASKHHAMQKEEQGLGKVKVGYNPNYIISMVVDKEGNVWCGTWGGGLSRFDGKTWKTYTEKDGLPGDHVFMLKEGRDGVMWIGTNHGLARFRASGNGFKVMTTADGLFANNVFSLAEASDGSLWVGSFGGVARIMGYQ
jgi:ligand-binding sensor domain-containing protein